MASGGKIVVLGVGNILLTDEGVGVRTIQELSKLEFPDCVEFIDGGTSGYGLIPMIEGAEKVIIVDAVDADAEPGTFFRFTPEDVMPDENERTGQIGQISLHDVGLVQALQLAKLTGNECETILFGVQPKSLDWGMELTSEIEEKLPRLIELVSKEIRDSLQGNEG